MVNSKAVAVATATGVTTAAAATKAAAAAVMKTMVTGAATGRTAAGSQNLGGPADSGGVESGDGEGGREGGGVRRSYIMAAAKAAAARAPAPTADGILRRRLTRCLTAVANVTATPACVVASHAPAGISRNVRIACACAHSPHRHASQAFARIARAPSAIAQTCAYSACMRPVLLPEVARIARPTACAHRLHLIRTCAHRTLLRASHASAHIARA
eukprot:5377387-Pleurochrysis_carterae.AAC.1